MVVKSAKDNNKGANGLEYAFAIFGIGITAICLLFIFSGHFSFFWSSGDGS
jgi:hypothetical protein